MIRLQAVCVGTAERIAAMSGKTGIFKRPARGPVDLGTTGLAGDAIVDRDNHGGPDQAVLMVGSVDHAVWAAALDRPLTPGFFGENLLIDGLDTATLCLGDVVETDQVRLQFTAPRIPCGTFAARVGDPGSIKLFYELAQPGAYARVLTPGPVCAGDPVRLVPYRGDRIGIAETLEAYRRGFDDLGLLARIARTPAHAKLRALIDDRNLR